MKLLMVLGSAIGVLLAFHGGMLVERSNIAFRAGGDHYIFNGLLGIALVVVAWCFTVFPLCVYFLDQVERRESR